MGVAFRFESHLPLHIGHIMALEWYMILMFMLVPLSHYIEVDIIVAIAILLEVIIIFDIVT